MRFWPPFLGAGVSVDFISNNFDRIDVSMRMRFWNKNYVKTHFGGSLYSMTDPFYMLMLMEKLGRDYIVWDKSATINFKKPGKGKVFASFVLNDLQINQIKADVLEKNKVYPEFVVNVIDEQGDIVCVVTKTLYVKKK
jgi:hypothetical protein